MATTTATAAPTLSAATDSIARAGYDAFNARAFDRLSSLYTDDVVLVVVPTGQELRGVAGVEQYMRSWIAAFDDARVEIELVAQAGDVAVCEFRGVGTHTGTLATPMGDLPATGRRVNVPFCEVMRLRDGRIASIHGYFDAATFAAQLGS